MYPHFSSAGTSDNTGRAARQWTGRRWRERTVPSSTVHSRLPTLPNRVASPVLMLWFLEKSQIRSQQKAPGDGGCIVRSVSGLNLSAPLKKKNADLFCLQPRRMFCFSKAVKISAFSPKISVWSLLLVLLSQVKQCEVCSLLRSSNALLSTRTEEIAELKCHRKTPDLSGNQFPRILQVYLCTVTTTNFLYKNPPQLQKLLRRSHDESHPFSFDAALPNPNAKKSGGLR